MASGSYHHGDLHHAIVAAAIAEARRSGPQGVQVRALAKTVGVSPAAVYRHVPSIEALLAEVAQAAREQLAVHLADRRDRAPAHRTRKAQARERFRAVGQGYVDFALAEPHLFDTAFTPISVDTSRPDNPSAWQVLTEGVQELVAAGLVTESGADKAALIAWSGVHGIASILVRNALNGPTDRDDAVDIVLDALMRSLESL